MKNIRNAAQKAINKYEGGEVLYLGSMCKIENGILYDLEQDAPNHIDLGAMSIKELLRLLAELESNIVIDADVHDEIAEDEDIDRIENNGSSGRYPDCDWYTVYMKDGYEHDVYVRRA